MKRLMLLGGNSYQLPVIKAAHELGYYVITCDYLPDNIAHKYSDEYCNVSIIDKDAVLNAARRLKVDGIMSFACDPGVTVAAYVAEQLQLPSVGSYEAVSILQNKGKFRKFLADNGFNVPMAKEFRSEQDALKEIHNFRWPIIVKPTDSAGSKGVSRVDSMDQLHDAIVYAIDHSFTKEFIIEDFLEKVGHSSDTDSFSVNGELAFVSFNSQQFDESGINPYAPAAYCWPASISAEHQEELRGELQRLVRLLGLKSSVYNIETRECTDGKAYIMEFTPRGGGNRLSEILHMATGVDLIKAAVLAAVGEPIDFVKQKPYNGFWAEIILHSDKSGRFAGLEIAESIQGNIVEEDLWVQTGAMVHGFEAANDSLGTLILRFDEEAVMQKVLSNIGDYVRVKLM